MPHCETVISVQNEIHSFCSGFPRAPLPVPLKHRGNPLSFSLPRPSTHSHFYSKFFCFLKTDPTHIEVFKHGKVHNNIINLNLTLITELPMYSPLQGFELQLKLFRILGELKLKSLSLSPINVKCEFEKTLPKQQNDQKPIVVWHTEFIKAKEQEIGKGIRSYKGTFNKFRTFLDKKGTILFEHLNKGLLEEFKQHLIKLGLEGPHLHKQFKNLRIFINWVKGNQDEQDQEIKIPAAYKQVKVKARYGDPIGLTVKQFLEFYQLDLSQHKE